MTDAARFQDQHTQALERIAAALERLSPPVAPAPSFQEARAFVWARENAALLPLPEFEALPLDLLLGIDGAAAQLLSNTRRFAAGRPANNALLWGARGMGKSSLVKAVFHEAAQDAAVPLTLVEIHSSDLDHLERLMRSLRKAAPRRFILFCDDLSFGPNEHGYRALKALLEGGVEGRPGNVLFYATSNRRHVMAREMVENERSTAIHPDEAVDEKVSLSDRFGLWLGFHPCTQGEYLEIVDAYAAHFAITMPRETLGAAALAWSVQRGARSGRVAWQFVQSVI